MNMKSPIPHMIVFAIISAPPLIPFGFASDGKGQVTRVDHAQSYPLIDLGPEAASARYRIDFGPLELPADFSRTYSLENLPKANFTLGIALSMLHPLDQRRQQAKSQTSKSNKTPSSDGTSPANNRQQRADGKPNWFQDIEITMKLLDVTDQKTIFEIKQPLTAWTWTNWGPNPGQSFLYCRDGASSSFETRPTHRYQLEITSICSSQTKFPIEMRLLMYGGGWKEDPRSGQDGPASFRFLRWLGL
jgi:hypothetical protein